MYEERLRRMSKLLRDDAANPTGVKFDLGTWSEPDAQDPAPGFEQLIAGCGNWALPEGVFGNDTARDDRYSDPEVIKVPVSCGTKACAFGLAAISGVFKDDGLTYRFLRNGAHAYSGMLLPAIKDDSGRWVEGFNAAAVLFDITDDDAQYFFDPSSYPNTPREAEGEIEVADRIDAFLAGEIDQHSHPAYRDRPEYTNN